MAMTMLFQSNAMFPLNLSSLLAHNGLRKGCTVELKGHFNIVEFTANDNDLIESL